MTNDESSGRPRSRVRSAFRKLISWKAVGTFFVLLFFANFLFPPFGEFLAKKEKWLLFPQAVQVNRYYLCGVFVKQSEPYRFYNPDEYLYLIEPELKSLKSEVLMDREPLFAAKYIYGDYYGLRFQGDLFMLMHPCRGNKELINAVKNDEICRAYLKAMFSFNIRDDKSRSDVIELGKLYGKRLSDHMSKIVDKVAFDNNDWKPTSPPTSK